jgi:hypothetical protein
VSVLLFLHPNKKQTEVLSVDLSFTELDYYKTIKLINFIRLSVAQKSSSQLQFQDTTNVTFEKSVIDWDNEMYLKPVIGTLQLISQLSSFE